MLWEFEQAVREREREMGRAINESVLWSDERCEEEKRGK